jgi:hypothetical protein
MLKLRFVALLIILLMVQPVEQANSLPMTQRAPAKITFDLSTISPDGLAGPASGVQSISYEFCIPATEEHLAEVQAIDPSVQHFPHSKGRIGCSRNQFLCIGNTHQPHWREVLLSLANLDYVERIDRFWGE